MTCLKQILEKNNLDIKFEILNENWSLQNKDEALKLWRKRYVIAEENGSSDVSSRIRVVIQKLTDSKTIEIMYHRAVSKKKPYLIITDGIVSNLIVIYEGFKK